MKSNTLFNSNKDDSLKDPKKQFIHHPIDESVVAIGGHYVFLKEICMPFNNDTLLYLIGCAVIDTSCCGMGGSTFALVPGFVVSFKTLTTPEGHSISTVIPITDQTMKNDLESLLKQKEYVQQVIFVEY